MHMIYIPIQGGLGNQLFQWSLAHYIATECKSRVTLVGNKDRLNSINSFDFLEQLALVCEHDISIKHRPLVDLAFRAIDKLSINHKSQAEALSSKLGLTTLSDPEAWESPKPYNEMRAIRGFFQDSVLVEKVWNQICPEITRQFESLRPRAFKTLREKGFNCEEDFQAIHIRRGDYLENEHSLGVLDLPFFKKNLDTNLKQLIFSDTLTRQELRFWPGKWILLNREDLNAQDTLFLMSRSRKLVMSNSTLSWWASRFVLEKNGTVVAPEPWFKNINLISDNYLRDNRITYSISEFK